MYVQGRSYCVFRYTWPDIATSVYVRTEAGYELKLGNKFAILYYITYKLLNLKLLLITDQN